MDFIFSLLFVIILLEIETNPVKMHLLSFHPAVLVKSKTGLLKEFSNIKSTANPYFSFHFLNIPIMSSNLRLQAGFGSLG